MTSPTTPATPSTTPAIPIIQIQNLQRSFGQTRALNDTHLTIPPGCVFGLVGANGAGKTTLIKHILGLLKPQAGTVSVFNLDPSTHPQQVLSRIGYLSEERDLPNWMRVGELIKFQKAFYPNWDDNLADQLLQAFNLDPTQRIKSLSKGQRARAALLVAVAHKPDLLLLDEPSSGLDPIVRRDILAEIIHTVADEGRTVLFSSHLLDEVERVADQIAIMNQGRVILTGALDHIKATHHRLTLRFDQSLPHHPSFPGLLTAQGEQHEWTILCQNDPTNLQASTQNINAKILNHHTPSLDEIFVAHAQHQAASNTFPRRAS